jgi:hypothetical protein
MKMQSGRLILCAGAVAAVASVGCQGANPLVGKWQMTQDVMGAPVTVVREFKADGTETMTNGMPGIMSTEIKYTVDGNKLNESVTGMTIDGQTVAVDATKLPPNAPESMTETFSVDGDKLTIANTTTGVQVTQTFDRVKED